MDTDWELEHWLYDTGAAAEQKRKDGLPLSPIERLVVEFWLFDMEALNGGISQYFCNYGLSKWKILREAWLLVLVPSLGPILEEVGRTIEGAEDPFYAVLDVERAIDSFYYDRREAVIREFRLILTNPPTAP